MIVACYVKYDKLDNTCLSFLDMRLVSIDEENKCIMMIDNKDLLYLPIDDTKFYRTDLTDILESLTRNGSFIDLRKFTFKCQTKKDFDKEVGGIK